MKNYTFHVNGMHCAACVTLTESEISADPRVRTAHSNLRSRTVAVTGDFDALAPETVAAQLSARLTQHSLSVIPAKKSVPWHEFTFAVPVALGFVFLFVLLQKLGIVHFVNTGKVSYGTAFVIGIIASLSTCMAVVGGLVLSLSATLARESKNVRPQILFHAGRLMAFFFLGGVIGAVGSAFQLGSNGTFILGLITGLVMLILGVNLLDIFHWTKNLQPAMPRFISKQALKTAKLDHSLAPVAVGIATFFLPCGFTQSMQVYTLSTGNFFTGGLTMLAFAIGTLPVLALVSFSSLSVRGSPQAGIFFKSAGLVVIAFAVFNIINSLAAVGLIRPVFYF